MNNTVRIYSNASLIVITDGITKEFYLSLFLIKIPGILTNIISLILIFSEARHTKQPTNFLLFVLCLTDLISICTTLIWHTFGLFGIVDNYNLCAIKVYTQTFCPIFSGSVSVLMAVDRALAFCAPFFYRSNVTKKMWSAVGFVGFVFISFICILPHIGLGGMWNPVYRNNTVTYRCSAFQYQAEPAKKTFLIVYSSLGIILLFAVIVCNSIVMISVLNLRKRLAETKKTTGSIMSSKATESRFAVIVGVLACVFVTCWGPYNVWVIYKLFNAYMSPDVIGNIHRLAGLNFTIDPFVYLLIRKSNRQVLRRILCYFRCQCRDELVDFTSINTTSSTQESTYGSTTTNM